MLAYHAYIEENPDIYAVASDGSSVEQITNESTHEREPDISPDGNHVVFTRWDAGEMSLLVASRDPGTGTWRPGRRLTSFSATRGRWSPDGSRILFAGTPERGVRSLFVIAPEGGDADTLVEAERLTTGIWSPDGHTVYYRAFDADGKTTFWSVPASGGTPRLIARLDDPRHITRGGIQFETDGKNIYFAVLEQETDIAIAELVATP